MKTPIPIFLFHIPKTGGTAVFATFHAALGNAHVLQINDTDPQRTVLRVQRHLALGDTLLFRGHLPPISFETENRLLRTVVMREPLDRMISHFCFVHMLRHDQPLDFAFFRGRPGYRASRFNEDDIEAWIAARHHDNTQTRFLAQQRGGKLDASALEAAKERLDHCQLVGVTENLGRYMALLAQLAGLDVRIPFRANSAPRDILDIDKDRLRRRLEPYIAFDSQLHEYARDRFERLAAQHPELGSSPLLSTPQLAKPWSLNERFLSLRHANPRELWQRWRKRYWRYINRRRDTTAKSTKSAHL